MSNIDLMRKKMVEGQILPHHSPTDALLWAFSQVNREKCVTPSHQKLAYIEAFVPQGSERYLMPANILSHGIQALKVHEQDTAFVIGAGTGYTPMILSYLANNVIAFEPYSPLVEQGKELMNQEGFHTVVYKKMDSFTALTQEPHRADIIFIEGALAAIPKVIKSCLKEGGRLLAFIITPLSGDRFPMTQATLIERYGSTFNESPLFLTEMPLFPSVK